MKLPTKRNNFPARQKSRAAARREKFEKKVASVMKATGQSLAEARVIPFRCAVTGRAFYVSFERSEPDRTFEVARIDKEEAVRPGSRGTRGRKATTYDGGEFDFSGWSCPWCGKETGFVYCSRCGETVCDGRVRAIAGELYYTCHDACGAHGKLQPYDKMHGAKDESRAMNRLTGSAKRLGGAAPSIERPRTALPGRGKR